ncbi:AAA family ATPase [Candidatus Thiodictyon syntrophicum]|jgi:predicted ATPase|uniref:ATPase n=1 Tax=Candidatus Thiodictyon syntrophicum TaxID=1166950 RepID=A0A2K8UEK5_9GAMM|nr:AAA family ATPase [Candidatus Thiodictyon syntrophicum]AUB84016.1 ATPase [Candidatus Thiodictyon syntrophicum]
MAKIEGFRVKNFRALKDVTIGKLSNSQQARPLTPMTAVIGKDGVGKSSLFDAFGFLADCLRQGVEEACDARGRGGFERIRSQGQAGPIEFEVHYQGEDGGAITYLLFIDLDATRRSYAYQEALLQLFVPFEWQYCYLNLKAGKGFAWSGEKTGEPFVLDAGVIESLERAWSFEFNGGQAEEVELEDPRRLGIATLGALKQHPHIADFRRFIDGWYLSHFAPDAARAMPLAGPQKHLNSHGDNLGNVVQFMEREHPKRFQAILDRVAGKIPGIDRIDCMKTIDDRLVLRFNDKGFTDPFYAQQMSDGTLKVFAYLLLLEDPSPPPFICIEEPENGLYHKLLETLAREFRQHATGTKGGSQIFVTTHQPYFVDALEPDEVWVLTKGADGFATIRRASEDPIVSAMVAEGLPLGGLWYSDYLDAR